MSLVCELDKTIHETREDLHHHLKGKLKQETYYLTYHPRFDLADGRPIPFKTVEQYLSQDFVDKNSMNKWLKADSPEAREWAVNWLKRRKAEKGLIYAPSQVELRTLSGPSMDYYEKHGGYESIAYHLGFKGRWYGQSLVFASDKEQLVGATIICDTREKAPLDFSRTTVKDTLNVGDYALAAPHDLGIRIERKSLSDFCGTLNDRALFNDKKEATGQTPLRRFEAELIRAQEQGLYVVMVVENSLSDALRFDYLPQTQYVKASPAYIFKNLRDLLVKYPLHFQAVFIDGREEMALKIPRIFEMGLQVKSVDLQYLYEKGVL